MCRYHQQSEQWVVYVTWNLHYCGVRSICFTPTGRKNVWSCGCCEVRPETWNLICVMPHPFSILSTALKCIVQRIHPLLSIEEMNLPRGNILWIGLCGFLRYLHYSKTLQQQSLMLDAASRQHAVVLSASMYVLSALHSRDLAWVATAWFRQWDGKAEFTGQETLGAAMLSLYHRHTLLMLCVQRTNDILDNSAEQNMHRTCGTSLPPSWPPF